MEAPRVRGDGFSRFPLLGLLHPQEQTRWVLLGLAVALVLWGGAVWTVGMPAWGATTLALGVLLVPGALKWRGDLVRYGPAVMLLSVMLALQGFHTLEHVAQIVQYHLLGWLPQRSSGLISAANAEWVHFVWNWGLVGVVLALMAGGMRNAPAWLLIGWACAHATEHSYMMMRYLELKAELARLGVGEVSAQGLPGILGRDGLLAESTEPQSLFASLPVLTTASRIDIHFWWNAGETALLLLAGHGFLARRTQAPDGVVLTRNVGILAGTAAALSLATALIHISVTLEHFLQWWGYGLFFLLTGVAQAALSLVLVRSPRPGWLVLGVLGNVGLILLWALTRTLGIPLFGPEAGEVEAMGALDLTAKVVEVVLVALLLLLLRRQRTR
ncbi:MAG: hypothetical protein M3P51_15055 [Chloroflexota bacterium]|nr:hypothetical protein [Chloroflexota bacterium]